MRVFSRKRPSRRGAPKNSTATSSSWRRFRRTPGALTGLILFGSLLLMALGADFIASEQPILLRLKGETYWFPNLFPDPRLPAYNQEIMQEMGEGDWGIFPLIPYGPNQHRVGGQVAILAPPSGAHWFGTDSAGCDVLARVIHGARVSLSVGLMAVALYVLMGLLLGGAAGFFGGWLDGVVGRLTETFLAFPALFLVIALAGILERPTLMTTMLVIAFTRWTHIARLVRGEVLRVKGSGYVTAARSLGAGPWRVLFRHVLPNAMSPILVAAAFGLAGAILLETMLSFLGLGAPPSMASWGELLAQAHHSGLPWWLTLFPGLAVFLTVLGANLLGEALRDATDPRLSEK